MLVTRLNEVPDTSIDWVVQNLWMGVGVIGGQPKTRKTFLALQIACSVASGQSMMLGDHSYKVPRPGNILYLAGEDSSSDLKRRISSIPDSFYIDTTKPQLDTQSGRHELIGAIGHLHPRLLVIDPFVRFHSTSENHITPMLHFLRGLATPVILVHHMAKGKTGGQGLRGSGDLHAWGDSNIYTISSSKLQVEFRHAPGRVIGRNKGASLSLIDRIKR